MKPKGDKVLLDIKNKHEKDARRRFADGMRDKLRNALLPIITLASIILIWAAAAAATDNPYVLPSVGRTVKEFFALFAYGEFYAAVGATILRAAAAFAVSFVVAGVTAFAAKKNKTADRLIAPLVTVLRALPTVAVVLLLLVWTNSEIAPMLVTVLVVFPTLFTNLKNALDSVDGELLEMCKVYGVPAKKVLTKVKIPAVLPQVTRAAGSGLSLNLKLMVAAEVLSQTAVSLGYFLSTSKAYFETAKMIALVLVAVILGLIIESVFERLAAAAEKHR